MSSKSIERLMQTADSLSEDEMLELAQLLIEQACLTKRPSPPVDVNSLAGTLSLDEDPMAIQQRMRH